LKRLLQPLRRKQNVPNQKNVAASQPLLKALKRKSVLQPRLRVNQNVAAKAQPLTLKKERKEKRTKNVALKMQPPKASRKRVAKKERRKTVARNQEKNNFLLNKEFLNLG
jgi:hypothetical protein